MNPKASAPMAVANRASSAHVIPQIFTNTLPTLLPGPEAPEGTDGATPVA
jgi:hypothetical protein